MRRYVKVLYITYNQQQLKNKTCVKQNKKRKKST